MERIIVVMLIVLVLCGCTDKKEERHLSIVVTAGGELVSAYRDGKNVTEERKALQVQTEENISRFLNRDRGELEFDMFCMLEEDGVTIDVMLDGVSYTFTCNIQGDIIGVGRSEREEFD